MAEVKRNGITLLVLFAALGVVAIVATILPHAANANRKEIRWLLTHQPSDVFIRASQVFADELDKESNGELKLVVITPAQIGDNRPGDLPYNDVLDALSSGKAELASVFTAAVAKVDPEFNAVNMPFRFESYSDLPAVLDGEEGASILNSLDAAGLHGLAFTLSGGFYIIASKDKKITSADDIKGMRIATAGGEVAQKTLEALGAIPVPTDLGSAPIEGGVDGIETTYSRLSTVTDSNSAYLKYINETNHALFSTVIVADSSFYASLTPTQQQALTKAAQKAALIEREDSIALNASTKQALIQKGSVVTELPEAAREVFKGLISGLHY